MKNIKVLFLFVLPNIQLQKFLVKSILTRINFFILYSCLQNTNLSNILNFFNQKNCKLKLSSNKNKKHMFSQFKFFGIAYSRWKTILNFFHQKKTILNFFSKFGRNNSHNKLLPTQYWTLKIISNQFSDNFFDFYLQFSHYVVLFPIHSKSLVHFETLNESSYHVLNSTSFQFCYFSLTCCFKHIGNKFLKFYTTYAVSGSQDIKFPTYEQKLIKSTPFPQYCIRLITLVFAIFH